MKVIINGYEVSVSAKHVWQEKASKKSTLEFLNELSIVYSEASEYNKNKGYSQTADTYNKTSDNLYDFNNGHGLYDTNR